MPRNMTEAKRTWCESTLRQIELTGCTPSEVLMTAMDHYIKGELTFHQLCVVMRDEGE